MSAFHPLQTLGQQSLMTGKRVHRESTKVDGLPNLELLPKGIGQTDLASGRQGVSIGWCGKFMAADGNDESGEATIVLRSEAHELEQQIVLYGYDCAFAAVICHAPRLGRLMAAFHPLQTLGLVQRRYADATLNQHLRNTERLRGSR